MASTTSLWPSQIRADVASPWDILQVQADALTQQTHRLLIGQLSRRPADSNGNVVLTLDIAVPALNDYQHRILVALHNEEMVYPVTIDAEVFRPKGLQVMQIVARALGPQLGDVEKAANRADSDKELEKLVEKVLSSGQVVAAATSLAARANEVLALKRRQAEASNGTPGQSLAEAPPKTPDE